MPQEADRSSILKVVLLGAGISIIVLAMREASSILSPFLLAGIIGVCVLPAARWMVRKGVPTWLAMLITIALVVLGVVGLIVLMVVSVNNLVSTLPQYQDSVQSLLDGLQSALSRVGWDESRLEATLGQVDSGTVLGVIGRFLSGVLSSLSGLVVMLMVLVFFILGAPVMRLRAELAFAAERTILERFETLIRDLQRYVGITTWINFLVAVANTIFLFVLGVEFAVLWGVLSFLMGYIPSIGFFVALIPPVLLALLQFGVSKALIVLVGYILINGGVQNFLQPKLMGSGLNLSVLVVIVSLIFWGWVLGPMGALLAIPLTMIVKDVFLEAYDDTRGLAELMSGAPQPGDEGQG